MYKQIFKNLIDKTIALIALIMFCPVIVICFVILFFDFKGNPLYIQYRPGLKEKTFKIFKFKTMKNTLDASGNLLPDSERITKVGKFIRRFSMDELPQILNVIKGDMSLIGPRPLLIDYLPLYNSFQKKRHLVKPGITGWAQINGRNTISWPEKFKYDVYYVENVSFYLDLKIFFLSIQKVLFSENINQSEVNTMEPFKGN